MTKHDLPDLPARPATGPTDLPELVNPWLGMRKTSRFFENEEITTLIRRGIFYARAGVPIHFQGTAGRGKTTIAMETAARLGRPISIMTGNDWMGADDLIGKEVGQTTRSVVDKFVQRVRRSEETTRYDWRPSILADAMKLGHTLVYDEFNRSGAQANGLLLSVLEEGVLITTDRSSDATEIRAHPEFRVILTSNPDDYAGSNAAPDALLDRMITFTLSSYSAETEAGIVATRTGLSSTLAHRIVRIVRQHDDGAARQAACSMRPAIMIAQIVASRLRTAEVSNALLAQIAADVLRGRGSATSVSQIADHLDRLN